MTEAEIKMFMRQALVEGRKAVGNCSPNPPVGCVIVKDMSIVARGHTNGPGEDHAEAMAIRELPHDLSNYSVFVTLEPCSFVGRTPSCAHTLASRRIGFVFVGLIDPHPRNRGAGISILRDSGASVSVGILEKLVKHDIGKYLTPI